MPAVSAAPPSNARWPIPPLVQASIAAHLAGAALAVSVPASAPWVFSGLVANHALLTGLGLWPRSSALGPNLRHLPQAAAARGEWALTIDDGPAPEVTPRVLDLLDAAGAKASFFLIAAHAERHPSLVREIVARGHDVHNHSHRHRHHFSTFGPAALLQEIGRAQAVIADLTGVRPICFRAPAGLRNPFLDPVLHRLDLHLVSWTRRGFDTRERRPDRVLDRLTRSFAPGDILLLHDGHAATTTSGQPVVLEVLPALLRRASSLGLRSTTLSACLGPRHPAAASGGAAR